MGKKTDHLISAKLLREHPMADFIAQTQERMKLFESPAIQMALEMKAKMDDSIPAHVRHLFYENRYPLTPKIIRSMYPLGKSIGNSFIGSMNFSRSVRSLNSITDFISMYGIVVGSFDHWYEDDTEAEMESFNLDATPADRPESGIVLIHEVSRLQKCIEDIHRDNAKLFKLRPRQFEEVSAELMRNQGFDVELTKQTRDGGFDLIAVRNLGDIPLRFLVECKRYAMHKPIGVKLVREFSNVIQTNNANKGLLLTTSYFSADAKMYREKFMPYQLDFRDRGDILEWVKAYLNS